jgi:hypothetical protein
MRRSQFSRGRCGLLVHLIPSKLCERYLSRAPQARIEVEDGSFGYRDPCEPFAIEQVPTSLDERAPAKGHWRTLAHASELAEDRTSTPAYACSALPPGASATALTAPVRP